MTRLRFRGAISLWLLAHASAALSGPLAQLELTTQEAAYQLQVEQSDKEGTDRTLVIRCLERCSQFNVYRERVATTPLGLFRLTDAYPLVLTTWAGGTSTRLKIYRIDPTGAKLVFNQYTLGTPTITPKGGVLSVTAVQYAGGGGAGSHRKVLSRTWTWKGERFVLAPR